MVFFYLALTTFSILPLLSSPATVTPTNQQSSEEQTIYNPFNDDNASITTPASTNLSPTLELLDQTQSTLTPPTAPSLDQIPATAQQSQDVFQYPLTAAADQNEQNYPLDSNGQSSLNRNQFTRAAPLNGIPFPSAPGFGQSNFLGPSNILTLPAVTFGNPVIPTPLLTSPAQPRLFNQNQGQLGTFFTNPYQQPFHQRFQIGPSGPLPLNNNFKSNQLRHPAALAQLNVFPQPITYDRVGMPIRGGATIRPYSQQPSGGFINLRPVSNNNFQAPKLLQPINTPSNPTAWSGNGENQEKPVREENNNENDEDTEDDDNDDAEEEDDKEEEDSNNPEADFDPFVDGFPFENDGNSDNWFKSFGNENTDEEADDNDDDQGVETDEDDGDKGASEKKLNIFPILDQHAFSSNQQTSREEVTKSKPIKQQKKKNGRKTKKSGKSLTKKKKPTQPKVIASESKIIEKIPAEQRQKMFKERWFLSKDI